MIGYFLKNILKQGISGFIVDKKYPLNKMPNDLFTPHLCIPIIIVFKKFFLRLRRQTLVYVVNTLDVCDPPRSSMMPSEDAFD